MKIIFAKVQFPVTRNDRVGPGNFLISVSPVRNFLLLLKVALFAGMIQMLLSVQGKPICDENGKSVTDEL